MRLPARALIVTLMTASWVAANPGPPLVNPTGAKPAAPGASAGAISADSSVDSILDALDVRGQKLDGFVADVTLKEEDQIGLSSTRTGRVWYQRKSPEDARIRINFTQREDEKNIYDERVEYALDAGWLIDRDYQRKVEVKRQVLAAGEKINLLKLGEGPFPLPIGQKKEDVHRQFDVTKVKPNKNDPAGTVHLKLVPKEETPLADKFSEIDVWVDTKTHFPRRIGTADPENQNFKTTDLENVKINPQPGLGDRDFALERISDADWQRSVEPFNE